MNGAILGRMRTPILLLVIAGMLSGCGDVAPIAPAPGPSALPSTPATIALTGTPGIGGSAGQVFLAAMVRDTAGRGVGSVAVHFSTSAGRMQNESVMSDGGGQAQATVLTSAAATITATAGSASGSITVTPTAAIEPVTVSPPPILAPPPLPPPGPGTPPPVPPAPTPAPVPPPPPPSLSVSLNCVPAPSGSATPCNLAATYGGAGIPSTAIIRVDWDFGDGSSQTVSGVGAALIRHTYAQAGTYLVVAAVDALTSDGDKGTSASQSVKVP